MVALHIKITDLTFYALQFMDEYTFETAGEWSRSRFLTSPLITYVQVTHSQLLATLETLHCSFSIPLRDIRYPHKLDDHSRKRIHTPFSFRIGQCRRVERLSPPIIWLGPTAVRPHPIPKMRPRMLRGGRLYLTTRVKASKMQFYGTPRPFTPYGDPDDTYVQL